MHCSTDCALQWHCAGDSERVILQQEYHGVLHSSVLVLQCVAVAVELFQGKSGSERWMAAAAAEETALSPIF